MAGKIGPLFVRIIAAPSVPGGKALALVTQDGELVGSQFGCTVDNDVNEIATITVRFYIDGKTIILGANDD